MTRQPLQITVIGIGYAGCVTIHALNKIRGTGYTLLAADSDFGILNYVDADEKLEMNLGEIQAKGRGSAGFYHYGKYMAESSSADIRAALSGYDLCILTYGLGGGTGSAGGPVLARIAKEEGATVLSLVSYPFIVEGRNLRNVGRGLKELIQWSDSVIIQDFNCMADYYHVPISDHLVHMNEMNAECIDLICKCMQKESALIPLNFEDAREFFKRGGFGYTYTASKDRECSIEEIVTECMNHPYLRLPDVSIKDVIILIEGGNNLDLIDCDEIVNRIADKFDMNINVIYGACFDSKTEEKLQVTVIVLTRERSHDIFRGFRHYGMEPMKSMLIPPLDFKG